jgi:hypothetical protein
MKCYVVTAPASVRGIYDTWPACEACTGDGSGRAGLMRVLCALE